jgi:outer membrane protein TolC
LRRVEHAALPFFAPWSHTMHILHLAGRRRPRRPAAALALAVLLGPGAPGHQALAEGLTLAQAQQRALERSRALPAQDAAVAAARELALAAGRLPDPVLRAGVDNLPVSGADRFNIGSDFMTMRRAGLMQELTGADKRRLRTRQFEQTADKAAAEKETEIARIEQETALAWLDLYFAKQVADLGTGSNWTRPSSTWTRRSGLPCRQGQPGRRVRRAGAPRGAQDKVNEFDTRVRTARSMLSRWAGPDADAAMAELPDIGQIRLDPDALDSQLAHHPDIAVLDREATIARTDVALAEANRRPDWSVEVAPAAWAKLLEHGIGRGVGTVAVGQEKSGKTGNSQPRSCASTRSGTSARSACARMRPTCG